MQYTNFFNGYDGFQRVEIGGLRLGVNLPPVIKQQFDAQGNEIMQGLPPYCPVECGVVDEYQQAPDTWMRGSAKSGSFFFPTAEGRGLWLDFNPNVDHKHHVAVVISIQGVNAVTGQKLVGFAPRLERYDSKCPIHDIEFGHDRFCEKCGYKWPSQNYIANTGTPQGLFWLDGFRNQNGQVRQFVFTPEEMKRGVAQNLIGNERVFAIGVAFFLSKEPRKEVNLRNILRFADDESKPSDLHYHSSKLLHTYTSPHWACPNSGSTLAPTTVTHSVLNDGHEVTCLNASNNPQQNHVFAASCAAGMAAMDEPEELVAVEPPSTDVVGSNEAMLKTTPAERLARKKSPMEMGKMYSKGPSVERTRKFSERHCEVYDSPKPKKPVKLEVGAGARIDQQVFPDPEPLEFWRDEPEVVIYLNYADEATVKAILGGGRIDMTKGGEGYLAGLPVGDPPVDQGV